MITPAVSAQRASKRGATSKTLHAGATTTSTTRQTSLWSFVVKPKAKGSSTSPSGSKKLSSKASSPSPFRVSQSTTTTTPQPTGPQPPRGTRVTPEAPAAAASSPTATRKTSRNPSKYESDSSPHLELVATTAKTTTTDIASPLAATTSSPVSTTDTIHNDQEGLSDYEKLRLRNMERNNARLAALGLLTTTINTTGSTAAAVRSKTTTKRKRPAQNTSSHSRSQPTRRSTRSRRSATTTTTTTMTSITERTSSSSVTFSDMSDSNMAQPPQEEEEEESYTVSPLLEYSMTGGASLSQQEEATDGRPTTTPSSTSTSTSTTLTDTAKTSSSSTSMAASLSLRSTRLEPPKGLSALYSLHFHPSQPNWIVGAGKAGIVAVWDTTSKSTDDSSDKNNEDDDGNDSYATIHPRLSWKAHAGRWIAEARWLPETTTTCHGQQRVVVPSRLITAGNDGTVCLWDLTTVSQRTGIPKLLHQTSKDLHTSGIFALDVLVCKDKATTTATTTLTVATGSKDKTVALSTWKICKKDKVSTTTWWRSQHHTAKVGDVRLHPRFDQGVPLLGSVGDDGRVLVHDPKHQRLVAESSGGSGSGHAKPHSFRWHPTETYTCLTAGYDKSIYLWDLRKLGGKAATPLATLEGHVPAQVTKCKRIHRPIVLSNNTSNNNNCWILTSGQSSRALSLFGIAKTNQDDLPRPATLASRGRLPEDYGDGGCLASCQDQVAVSNDHGQVLLLRANLVDDDDDTSREKESNPNANRISTTIVR